MEEISLRQLVETVWKGKWLISVITIVCVLVTGLATYIMLPDSKSAIAIIELNFPGIEKGENPDGSKFDIQQLRAPYVINEAVTSLSLADKGEKPENIRRNIDIIPIVPNDILSKAESMLQQGNDYTYYPSEYKIMYKVNKGFSYNQGQQLLTEIIKQYEEYFYSLYSNRNLLESTIGSIKYESYDYPDIVSVMNTQLDAVEEFLTVKYEEANTFRAKTTGYTFGDLQKMFDVIKTVDLNRLESVINANNLTKDKDALIKNYEYKIKRMEVDRAKKASEAEEARMLMDQFKKEELVLIPNSSGGELTAENPASYYNTLAEKAIEAGVEATNLQHDIEYYTGELERLNSLSSTSNTKLLQQADGMIDTIKLDIQDKIDLTNTSLDDYYTFQYGSGIRRISPVQIETDLNILLNLAIALVIGLMVGIFTIFIREYWRNSTPDGNEQEQIQ